MEVAFFCPTFLLLGHWFAPSRVLLMAAQMTYLYFPIYDFRSDKGWVDTKPCLASYLPRRRCTRLWPTSPTSPTTASRCGTCYPAMFSSELLPAECFSTCSAPQVLMF